jgi:hypothetical protein
MLLLGADSGVSNVAFPAPPPADGRYQNINTMSMVAPGVDLQSWISANDSSLPLNNGYKGEDPPPLHDGYGGNSVAYTEKVQGTHLRPPSASSGDGTGPISTSIAAANHATTLAIASLFLNNGYTGKDPPPLLGHGGKSVASAAKVQGIHHRAPSASSGDGTTPISTLIAGAAAARPIVRAAAGPGPRSVVPFPAFTSGSIPVTNGLEEDSDDSISVVEEPTEMRKFIDKVNGPMPHMMVRTDANDTDSSDDDDSRESEADIEKENLNGKWS